MGGIRVDAESQETTVPGLYACGEAASGLRSEPTRWKLTVRFDYVWKACW